MNSLKNVLMVAALSVFVASCTSLQGSRFGPYSDAEKAFSQGQYDKAIEKYGAYLAQNPNGNMAVIAKYYTAKSQAALGRTGLAVQGYEEVIRDYPRSDWAHFSKKRIDELAAVQ